MGAAAGETRLVLGARNGEIALRQFDIGQAQPARRAFQEIAGRNGGVFDPVAILAYLGCAGVEREHVERRAKVVFHARPQGFPALVIVDDGLEVALVQGV